MTEDWAEGCEESRDRLSQLALLVCEWFGLRTRKALHFLLPVVCWVRDRIVKSFIHIFFKSAN